MDPQIILLLARNRMGADEGSQVVMSTQLMHGTGGRVSRLL